MIINGHEIKRADLYGANLNGANLRAVGGALCLGYDPRGYRFVGIAHNDGWRVLAGCRWFTLDQAREHWANNPDALARIAILDAHNFVHARGAIPVQRQGGTHHARNA